LHSQGVAHRDIQPAIVCVALDYDLSLTENETQIEVWPSEVVEEAEEKKGRREKR